MNKQDYITVRAAVNEDSGQHLLGSIVREIKGGTADAGTIRRAQYVEAHYPEVWKRNHWLRYLGGYNPDLPAEQMRADVLAEIEDDLREFEATIDLR